MDYFFAPLKIISAACVAGVSFAFGEFTTPVKAMLVFMALDYITGVIAAAFKPVKINSTTAIQGIYKKVGMLALVVVGNLLDMVAGYDNPYARTLVVSWLISTEGLSIIENLDIVGIKMPDKLRQLFEIMRDKEGGGNSGK